MIPSLSVSRGCMASAEEEAAAAPPAEESAGMKQFYINEQRRQEMEHGQSAPLAGPHLLRLLGARLVALGGFCSQGEEPSH